jgi:predicted TIM-barrel fold metal-dependent hydrolase
MTNAGDRYLSDPSFEPVFAALDDRAAVVLIHPTSPTCWPTLESELPRPVLEFVFDTTRTVTDLLLGGTTRRHPNLRIIVPHGGAALPLLAERVQTFRDRLRAGGAGPGPDAPIQEQLRGLWYDTAGTPFPVQIPALTQVVGLDRVVYGSDYCWTPASGVGTQIRAIDQAPPPATGETWRTLTTRNAHVLLSP